MGIKELWSIVEPFCERKPLYTLGNYKNKYDETVCNLKRRGKIRNVFF